MSKRRRKQKRNTCTLNSENIRRFRGQEGRRGDKKRNRVLSARYLPHMAIPLRILQTGSREHAASVDSLAAANVTPEEEQIRVPEEGTTSDLPRSCGRLTKDVTGTRSPDFPVTTGHSAGSAQLRAPAPSPASAQAPGGAQPKRRRTGRATQGLGTPQEQRTFLSGGTVSPDTSNHVTPLSRTSSLVRPEVRPTATGMERPVGLRQHDPRRLSAPTARHQSHPGIRVTESQYQQHRGNHTNWDEAPTVRALKLSASATATSALWPHWTCHLLTLLWASAPAVPPILVNFYSTCKVLSLLCAAFPIFSSSLCASPLSPLLPLPQGSHSTVTHTTWILSSKPIISSGPMALPSNPIISPGMFYKHQALLSPYPWPHTELPTLVCSPKLPPLQCARSSLRTATLSSFKSVFPRT